MWLADLLNMPVEEMVPPHRLPWYECSLVLDTMIEYPQQKPPLWQPPSQLRLLKAEARCRHRPHATPRIRRH
jgi:hypothetical protein